jgi:hypothetical protein
MQKALFLLLLPLAACTLPGRQNFAPTPVAANSADITATGAFKNRIPLVIIQPGTTDFAAPVADAVRQALAIKPSAAFLVDARAPGAGLKTLTATATAVSQSIVADGVAPGNVSLMASSTGHGAGVYVYVK